MTFLLHVDLAHLALFALLGLSCVGRSILCSACLLDCMGSTSTSIEGPHSKLLYRVVQPLCCNSYTPAYSRGGCTYNLLVSHSCMEGEEKFKGVSMLVIKDT